MNEKNTMENFQKLDVPGVSLVAGLLSLLFNIALYILSKLFFVSLSVPRQIGSTQMIELGLFHILLASILPALLAGFIFWTLRKVFQEKGIRDFLVVCVVFLLFSLGGPLSLQSSVIQKGFLISFHLISAFCISWTFYTYHKEKHKQ